MDGGLVLTGNLLVMREGEVVGHLSHLRMLECSDGTAETEVCLHLKEPKPRCGAPAFHAWREVGEGLKPEEHPQPDHPNTQHEVEPICYDSTCAHFEAQPEEGDGKVCPHAVIRGWLALTEDSVDGTWIHLSDLDLRCEAYEQKPEAETQEGG